MEESILFGPEIDDRALDREIDDVNDALAETGRISPDIDTSGLGDIEMGATMGAGNRGGMGRDIGSLVPMADYRNRLLEDILDTLQGGGAGGDGGGPGGLLTGFSLRGLLSGAIGALTITPGMLVGGLASITAGSLIANRANITPGDLINDPVSVGQQALLEGLIASPVGLTANAVLNHVFGESAGDASRSGESGGGFGIGKLLAGLGIGGGAFAFLNRGAIGGALRGAGSRVAGFGRGLLGGASSLAGIPSRVLQDLERRGVTDLLGGGAGGAQFAATGALGGGGLLQALLGGGRQTPGQRAAARARDQRFRNAPGANPGQVARNLNTNVDITIDPSGLNDLKRDIQRELEQSLVPQIVSQVERELSTGLGGG